MSSALNATFDLMCLSMLQVFTSVLEEERAMDKGQQNEYDDENDLCDALIAEDIPPSPLVTPAKRVKGKSRPLVTESSDSEVDEEEELRPTKRAKGKKQAQVMESSDDDEEEEEEEVPDELDDLLFDHEHSACDEVVEPEEQEAKQEEKPKGLAADADESEEEGESDMEEEDGLYHRWGDQGSEGEIEEEAAHATKEGQKRTVVIYGSIKLISKAKTTRIRKGEHAWMEFEDGSRHIVEFRNFYDDNHTGDMMSEVYLHYTHKQLSCIPCFNPNKKDLHNAFSGWSARCELVQEKYPCHVVVDSIVEKVLVSNHVMCPKRGKPSGGAKYFYRYVYDNLKCKMEPNQTMNY